VITTAITEELVVGDRVYLATDPRQDEGVVARVEGGRFFVHWTRTGRTWIYAAAHLVKVSA